MTVDDILEADELKKTYGPVQALRGVTLHIAAGEIFGLVGPDGAGKTTILRILCGIIPPSGGSARIAGYDVVRQSEKIRDCIGYMPQRFSLYEDLTVDENLAFFSDLYSVPRAEREERSRQLLAFSRLEPFRRRLAQYLSGGMKQKLALACTLMHRPRVLLLDEPTTGVDPVSRREFWQILHTLLRDGVTIVYSTPYMDEAERCSRAAFMSEGTILTCGTPAELKAQARGTVLELRAEPYQAARHALRSVPHVQDVQAFGDKLHVVLPEPEAAIGDIRNALDQAGVTVERLVQIQPSLEDVFMQLSRRARS